MIFQFHANKIMMYCPFSNIHDYFKIENGKVSENLNLTTLVGAWVMIIHLLFSVIFPQVFDLSRHE